MPSADGHKGSFVFLPAFFYGVGNMNLKDMMLAENPKKGNVQNLLEH
jgi:hypothetical protein